MSQDEKLTAMRTAMMQLGEITGTIVEASTGYKAQCLAAGFGERAADEMAVAFHAEVVKLIFAGMSKNLK
jgi:hypothetical protein